MRGGREGGEGTEGGREVIGEGGKEVRGGREGSEGRKGGDEASKTSLHAQKLALFPGLPAG